MDLFQLNLQFLGDEHRHRSIGALAHFDLGYDQRNAAVAIDPDEGVRSKVLRR